MAAPIRQRPGFWLAVAIVFWVSLALWVASQVVCLSAWVRHGITVRRCPDGAVRQTVTVQAQGLRRGQPGTVRIRAQGHYTCGPADWARTAPVRRLSAEISLLDAKGAALPLEQRDDWEQASDKSLWRRVVLPDVPDGDYTLRAMVRSPLGETQQELKLEIYAPARVHVITDRPLYEPGNVVRFRSVALRARDLAPLDGRPGRWIVRDPGGQVLLEERAPAGPWGVSSGSFPLDSQAESGAWVVVWESGGARDEVTFRVEPFSLPRFRVELQADRPYYRPGDVPVVRGAVIYSSGAPVADAAVELRWQVEGGWPPPGEWLGQGPGALPAQVTAGPDGRFRLVMPRVPADLLGQARLRGVAAATDGAGDRVAGGVTVLLSKEALAVTTVTELQDGLMEGFNNRLYLRATTPDGRALPDHELLVRRAWEPSDEGQRAETDADGVAALQIDPGPPVNVVIPPLPVRLPPRRIPVERGESWDLIAGARLELAAQVALDEWVPSTYPCARFVPDGRREAQLGLRVAPGGKVVQVVGPQDAAGRCLLDAARRLRLPAGRDRLLRITFTLQDPDLPKLQARWDGLPAVPTGLPERIAPSLLAARSCFAEEAPGGRLPVMLEWRTQERRAAVALSWLRDVSGRPRSAAALRCLRASVAGVELPEEAKQDAVGLVRLDLEPSARMRQARPTATTMLGYELEVTASLRGQEVGRTRIRLRPGSVPPLRLRVTPVLARPGETVTVELIRGPGYEGGLPEHLWLRAADGSSVKARFDAERRVASFELPVAPAGWYTVAWSGAQALLYSRSDAELTLQLAAAKEVYAPGDMAEIAVRTLSAGRGTEAAVGLFGVDESLSQLVPLAGPDDMARLRPKVETPRLAFDLLDGAALAMGRIRGANAAAATVLRVTQVPTPPDLDISLSASARGTFDPVAELTDSFYRVLAELHRQARSWEAGAPKGELMRPATLAKLWDTALRQCAARGDAPEDAFGRPLRLKLLPADLLALTDPRSVVIEGTRLPEDVEDWAAWVRRQRR